MYSKYDFSQCYMIITSILQEGTGKIIEGDVSPLMNFC
jgi:hypothetical protein